MYSTNEQEGGCVVVVWAIGKGRRFHLLPTVFTIYKTELSVGSILQAEGVAVLYFACQLFCFIENVFSFL